LNPWPKGLLAQGFGQISLMDSWFSAPSIVSTLGRHMSIICMLKDHPNWRYEYKNMNIISV
jgi:hypothetical protein